MGAVNSTKNSVQKLLVNMHVTKLVRCLIGSIIHVAK